MSAVTNRRSMMLDKLEYDRVSVLAKKAGVARPVVIAALLDCADEGKVAARLAELRASDKASSVEEREKRAALAKLASQLDMSQIQALMKRVSQP